MVYGHQMSGNSFTKAKFWKCALQVNPFDYINYRGATPQETETQYNKELLAVCLEENIKVIGLANHGNVDCVKNIRDTFSQHGIVVFPGFEIASSEKIHLVCLFSEFETVENLKHYLYDLDIDKIDGTKPSPHSADYILKKVHEKGGFVYAAHCTDDSGVLKKKQNNIWKNPLLQAAQIPTTILAHKIPEQQANYQILQNKNPDYVRATPMVIINAKDVEKPETLKKSNASCLIKMTEPSFEAFKQAFNDPESRVRLNSDINKQYYSKLESASFIGGYLDGIEIEFSEHLNSIIGGRGTGKSTLIECIRYAIDATPIGKQAEDQHKKIVKSNLGVGQVKLVVKSAAKHGMTYKIARRFGHDPVVTDMNDEASVFTPKDLWPEVEVFGQNEIHEIAKCPIEQLKVVNRFLDREKIDQDSGIESIKNDLADSRQEIIILEEGVSDHETNVKMLETLEEDAKRFKDLGIDEQLKILPILAEEKTLFTSVKDELDVFLESLKSLIEKLPLAEGITEELIKKYPDQQIFIDSKLLMAELSNSTVKQLNQVQKEYLAGQATLKSLESSLDSSLQDQDDAITKEFKKINPVEGKAGSQIGQEYAQLVKDIDRLKPSKIKLDQTKHLLTEVKAKRKKLLSLLSERMAFRGSELEGGVKRLNRKLKGSMRVKYTPEGNRLPLVSKIVSFQIPGVAHAKLAWINTALHISPALLATKIAEGKEAVLSQHWGCTDSTAEKLVKITNSQVLEIEEFIVDDLVSIELNVSSDETPVYRSLDSLSTGQQCTALLSLLLLDNQDPLFLDQPEDNLDNAFIADRIVTQIRTAKLTRQFIFATHNANIPVFGDAEWIGVLEANADKAFLPHSNQGSIDQKIIQTLASKILEGGEDAFNRRKEKYGFK